MAALISESAKVFEALGGEHAEFIEKWKAIEQDLDGSTKELAAIPEQLSGLFSTLLGKVHNVAELSEEALVANQARSEELKEQIAFQKGQLMALKKYIDRLETSVAGHEGANAQSAGINEQSTALLGQLRAQVVLLLNGVQGGPAMVPSGAHAITVGAGGRS